MIDPDDDPETDDEPEPRWNSDDEDQIDGALNDKAYQDWLDKTTEPIKE